jgi:hypothetical protein
MALCIFYICVPFRVWGKDVHDIHICLTELKFNETSSSFQVSIKIFIDDLELALRKEGTPGLFIGTLTEISGADGLINGYIKKHFKIDVDGMPLEMVFLGKEISEDSQAVWCYVEFAAAPMRGRKCTISNEILFSLFEDQRNIMDIRMNKSQKDYTIFQPGRNTWTYTF